jgi:hypothetical protein
VQKLTYGWRRLPSAARRLCSGEQKTDKFGLPAGSGLLENMRKMRFGRSVGYAASLRGGPAAVAFHNFNG